MRAAGGGGGRGRGGDVAFKQVAVKNQVYTQETMLYIRVPFCVRVMLCAYTWSTDFAKGKI